MLLTILIILIITYFFIELKYQYSIDSSLILKPKEFERNTLDSKTKYIAIVEIKNTHKRMEVMIPFFKVDPKVIGISKDSLISIRTKILALHPDEEEQNLRILRKNRMVHSYPIRYLTTNI